MKMYALRAGVIVCAVLIGVSGCGKSGQKGNSGPPAPAAQTIADSDVQQCIQGIIDRSAVENKQCNQYVQVNSASITDRHITDSDAVVIAQVELRVTQMFGKGNILDEQAKYCTGSSWNGNGMFQPGQIITIDKKLTFEKFDSGWRCDSQQLMQPIEGGSYR